MPTDTPSLSAMIETLEKAAEGMASASPWKLYVDDDQMVLDEQGNGFVRRVTGYIKGLNTMGDGETGFMSPETATFVMAMREQYPSILAHLRRAQAMENELKDVCDLYDCERWPMENHLRIDRIRDLLHPAPAGEGKGK